MRRRVFPTRGHKGNRFHLEYCHSDRIPSRSLYLTCLRRYQNLNWKQCFAKWEESLIPSCRWIEAQGENEGLVLLDSRPKKKHFLLLIWPRGDCGDGGESMSTWPNLGIKNSAIDSRISNLFSRRRPSTHGLIFWGMQSLVLEILVVRVGSSEKDRRQ